jgi:aldehyde:ferredoxin oxidoreductase
MWILRINMATQNYRQDEVPEAYRNMRGRGLSAMILNQEVDPTCHPLGRGNRLVLAPGLLAGTMAPSFGRISMGAKSPLTNGIKEANAEEQPPRSWISSG